MTPHDDAFMACEDLDDDEVLFDEDGDHDSDKSESEKEIRRHNRGVAQSLSPALYDSFAKVDITKAKLAVQSQPVTQRSPFGIRILFPDGHVEFPLCPRGSPATDTEEEFWDQVARAIIELIKLSLAREGGIPCYQWLRGVTEDDVRRAIQELRDGATVAAKKLTELANRKDKAALTSLAFWLTELAPHRLNRVMKVEELRAGGDVFDILNAAGPGVYMWGGLREALVALYDGRSGNMDGRGIDHLLGILSNVGKVLWHQIAAKCEYLIQLPVYQPSGKITDKEEQAKFIALIELAYQIGFGTFQRNEAILDLRRKVGLLCLDDTVVGANATPCLEPPTPINAASLKSILNPEYYSAVRVHKRALRELQKAVVSGSLGASMSALSQVGQARARLAAVLHSLSSRKALLLSGDASAALGCHLPPAFQRPGATFLMWHEEGGEEETLLSLPELDRPHLGGFAFKGRLQGDPNAPEITWEHPLMHHDGWTKNIWRRLVPIFVGASQQAKRDADYERLVEQRAKNRPPGLEHRSRRTRACFDGDTMYMASGQIYVDGELQPFKVSGFPWWLLAAMRARCRFGPGRQGGVPMRLRVKDGRRWFEFLPNGARVWEPVTFDNWTMTYLPCWRQFDDVFADLEELEALNKRHVVAPALASQHQPSGARLPLEAIPHNFARHNDIGAATKHPYAAPHHPQLVSQRPPAVPTLRDSFVALQDNLSGLTFRSRGLTRTTNSMTSSQTPQASSAEPTSTLPGAAPSPPLSSADIPASLRDSAAEAQHGGKRARTDWPSNWVPRDNHATTYTAAYGNDQRYIEQAAACDKTQSYISQVLQHASSSSGVAGQRPRSSAPPAGPVTASIGSQRSTASKGSQRGRPPPALQHHAPPPSTQQAGRYAKTDDFHPTYYHFIDDPQASSCSAQGFPLSLAPQPRLPTPPMQQAGPPMQQVTRPQWSVWGFAVSVEEQFGDQSELAAYLTTKRVFAMRVLARLILTHGGNSTDLPLNAIQEATIREWCEVWQGIGRDETEEEKRAGKEAAKRYAEQSKA